MNIVTAITLFRLALLPLIIALLLQQIPWASFLAFVLFVVVILSDILAGFLIKRKKNVTRFGSFLDPFSDKIIIYALLALFSFRSFFLWLVLAVFLMRDLIVLFHRYLAAKQDLSLQEEPSRKWRIAFQYALLLALLLGEWAAVPDTFSFFASQFAIAVLALGAVVYAIASLLFYVTSVLKELRMKIKMGKNVQPQPMIILANKKARGYRDAYRRRLLRIFARRRKARIHYVPLSKGELFTRTEKLARNINHVVIAGGDGSFESALNHLPFWKKSLGFFPLGAGNAFYSYFYRGKRFEYLRSRFPFREVDLDVLELTWDGGKRQTLFASVGIDAEVLRFVKKRTLNGLVDYVAGCWQGLFKGKADYDFTLAIDGKKQRWENCSTLVLGKIPFYGYGLRSLVAPIVPDDKQVYGSGCVNTHSLWLNKPLRLWGLLLGMMGLNKAPLFEFRGKVITVRSDVPFPIQAGGEFLGYSQTLQIKVKRQQKVLLV